MASNASRRAKAAANRGGGLLSSPPVTAASMASQLQADQARDRKAGLTNRVVMTTPKQSSSPSKGTGGTKLNPLPPGINIGARMAAEQHRDRMSEERESTGELANLETEDEDVFLQTKTRSYSRPDVSDAEQAMEKQSQMRRTAKSLFVNGTGPSIEEPLTTQSAPTPQQTAFDEEPAPQIVEFPEEEFAEEETAADLAQDQAEDARQRQALASSRASNAAQQARTLIETNKRVRTVIKAVQAAGAESLFPIFTLWMQMNAETVNKWIFKVRIPSIIEPDPDPKIDANDVATGCMNVTCCFGCLPMGLFFVVLLFALIWWADADPLGASFEFIQSVFSGVFG
jgi:hypothetical protein